jgi:virulence-associated protein VagC
LGEPRAPAENAVALLAAPPAESDSVALEPSDIGQHLRVHHWWYIHPAMETKVFQSGNSKAIRLPKDLELPCGPVSIRREGSKLIIEELTENGWPTGFFDSIRISRKRFGREIPEYREKSL